MSKYWIGTVEQYEQAIENKVKLDVTVKQHSPIYSPDRTEVLVKGIGSMTIEQVKEYQSANWIIEEEI